MSSNAKARSSPQLPNKSVAEAAGSSKELPNIVLLRSMDGEEHKVDAEILAMQSGTLKNIIEDKLHGDCIPLPNVSNAALVMILEFFKFHCQHSKREVREKTGFLDHFKPDPLEEELQNFDRKFVKDLDRETLLDLALAADFLDAKKLLDLTCQAVADSIKDMSVEDVRDYFNIENDFTPEEEKKLRLENEWAFK